MKIQLIKQKIINRLQDYKYKKQQKIINKYIKINDTTTAYDSYEKMYEAREVIANYAKHNGVSIEIADARRELSEADSPLIENYLSERISIAVKNLKTKMVEKRIIPVINDKIPGQVIYATTKRIMLDIPSEGLQRIVNVKSHFEENFLRNLYRNISEMTNLVK